MLFNSFEFALFLTIVFVLYWYLFNTNLRLRNFFLVAVSYLFYGWWDWRFLILIAITTFASFLSGILIKKNRNNCFNINCKIKLSVDKTICVLNICINVFILCIFKYLNFFGENLSTLFKVFGFGLDWVTIDILLPVGISFYTFQALSYTIDVYRNKINPTHDIVAFFAYVSFFPQLVAGPIERATNLLPQFYCLRKFKYLEAIDGSKQILWGFFKKIVIADNCAIIANDAFSNFQEGNGSFLLLGAIMFTFQIYGDFSGYSDIAIGVSKLFGFKLMQNFNLPYFSRDIAEFWRKWHISLTTWFRDYIYIPLGGSRVSKIKSIRNTIIIFLISGFWHGANWTFIIWGLYHAVMFIPMILLNNNRKNLNIIAVNNQLPTFKEFIQMCITFLIVMVGWIIFRSETIDKAFHYIARLFTNSIFCIPNPIENKINILFGSIGIIILLTIEWINRASKSYYSPPFLNNTFLRWTYYIFIGLLIIYCGGSGSTFIYFQF